MKDNEHLSDFLHHLHDTIILLGGGTSLALKILRLKDRAVQEEDVDDVRNYNIRLIEEHKNRLICLNKTTLRVQP